MKKAPFLNRLGYALNGILAAFKSEASFRFQIFAASVAFIFLIMMKASPVWFAIFSIVIGGVLSAELLNTALEHLIDHLHPERHPSIKLAKDCAAGAVLVFSLVSLIVLGCFLCERFLA